MGPPLPRKRRDFLTLRGGQGYGLEPFWLYSDHGIPVFIYGLADNDGRIRYVGKTERPRERETHHRCAPMRPFALVKGDLYRQKPKFLILEVCGLAEAHDREMSWIEWAEKKHGELINADVRGKRRRRFRMLFPRTEDSVPS